MASELRVNTLKDANGNNSIGLSYVSEGSAKAWYVFDGGRTTGTTSIEDDFNIASLVDNGTGPMGRHSHAAVAVEEWASSDTMWTPAMLIMGGLDQNEESLSDVKEYDNVNP